MVLSSMPTEPRPRTTPTTPTTALASVAIVLLAALVPLAATPATAAEQGSGAPLTLELTLVDEESGQPIENATVTLHNQAADRSSGEDRDERAPPERSYQNLATGPDGSLEAEVYPGYVDLHATQDGYKDLSAEFKLEHNLSLTLEVAPFDQEPAVLHGQVVDQDSGEALDEGFVRVRPASDTVHAERDSRQRTVQDEQGDEVTLRITHIAPVDRTGSQPLDEDGTWSIEVVPGEYHVFARAVDHLEDERTVDASSPGQHRVDIALAPLPPESVELSGQVVDVTTGEPVPFAEVRAENLAWGMSNGTMTDEEGRYALDVRPGYQIVRVEADQRYRVCQDGHAHDEPRKAVSQDDGEPRRSSCEADQRPYRYHLNVTTFQPGQDETIVHDVALTHDPAPDHTLQGWVLNASTGEPVEGATVEVGNLATGTRGTATTGPDGSYTIEVTEGPYGVRAQQDGYFPQLTNVHVSGEEPTNLTLRLTPGEPADRGCCYAHHGERVVEHESGSGTSQEAGASDDGSSGGSASSSQGQMGFTGGPGDLGPHPDSQSDDPAAGIDAVPAVGWAVVATALAMVAAVVGRR